MGNFLKWISAAFVFVESILYKSRLFAPFLFIYLTVTALIATIVDFLLPFAVNKAQKGPYFRWNRTICQESGFKYPKNMDSVSDEERKKLQPLLQYTLKHAVGIYPPWFLAMNYLLPTKEQIFKSTRELIADWFGLAASDRSWMLYPKMDDTLIDQKYTFLNLRFVQRNYKVLGKIPLEKIPGMKGRGDNDKFKPPYYLIRDDGAGCYVLCVRGSSTLNDWITDFTDAKSQTPEFYIDDVGGQIHDGMLKSAQYIYNAVIFEIRHLYATEKQPKPLYITGHSLGAGVASCLGLLMLQEAKKNKDIIPHLTVYSFAPPCVMSKNIADMPMVKEHVVSIVLNTDLITRGSAMAAKGYKDRVRAIKEDESRSDAELGLYFSAKPLSTEIEDPQSILYPGGTIYWFVPKNLENKGKFGLRQVAMSLAYGDNTNYAEKDWELKNATKNREVFGEILCDGYEALYAHMPSRYAWAMGMSTGFQDELQNGSQG